MVAATECAQLPCVLATQRLPDKKEAKCRWQCMAHAPYPASRRMLRDQHLYSGLEAMLQALLHSAASASMALVLLPCDSKPVGMELLAFDWPLK